MSYQSVGQLVGERGVAMVPAATNELLRVVHDAIAIDLPEGAATLTGQVQAFLAGNQQLTTAGQAFSRVDYDPSSTVGRQLIRICGTEVARTAFEDAHGVRLALLNCCIVLVSHQPLPLSWLVLAQIDSQKTPDC